MPVYNQCGVFIYLKVNYNYKLKEISAIYKIVDNISKPSTDPLIFLFLCKKIQKFIVL